MKYDEQVKFLANNKVSIAVGTPARIGKLLVDGEPLSQYQLCVNGKLMCSIGGLRINQHTHVLLDIGHRDSSTSTPSSVLQLAFAYPSRNAHTAHVA